MRDFREVEKSFVLGLFHHFLASLAAGSEGFKSHRLHLGDNSETLYFRAFPGSFFCNKSVM